MKNVDEDVVSASRVKAIVDEVRNELVRHPIPKRLLVHPKTLEQLEDNVRVKDFDPGASVVGLPVFVTSVVDTWAIEMSDGTFQLPEDELENDG